ncbi:MAG: PAS domain-containing protein [Bryobacterales bacterium]|nr:PAS domain-containing protein [Bryobacterales bacterium]
MRAVLLALVASALGLLFWAVTASHLNSRRVFRIGTNNSYPYHRLDANGEASGLAVDVLRAAARRAGVQLKWVFADDVGRALLSHEVDLWPVASSALRDDYPPVYLSRPWLRNEYALATLEGHPTQPENIRILAMPPAAVARRIFSILFPTAQAKMQPGWEEALSAVCKGEAQGAIVEVRLAQYYLEQSLQACSGLGLQFAGLNYPWTDLSIAARPEFTHVAIALRKEIDAMASSGELRRILSPWALFNANDAQAIYREDLQWRNTLLAVAVAVLIGVATIVFYYQWRRFRAKAIAAQAAEDRLHHILSSVREVVWRSSPSRSVTTYISPAAEVVFGRAPADWYISENLWAKALHPEDVAGALDAVAAGAGGSSAEIRYRILRPDGTYRWIYDRMFPVHDGAGKVSGLDGFALDITDLMTAELSLRDSERRFRALIERSDDCLTLLGAQGTILFASPAAERLTGIPPEAILGRNAIEFVAPQDRAAAQKVFREVSIEPGVLLRAEFRMIHPDGSLRIVECHLRNLSQDKAVGGIVVNSRDISWRKEAGEQKEILINELAVKNSELDRFTYTVSHDLKGPLLTICGYLGFVRDAIQHRDWQRSTEDLERIGKAARKLQQMLDELLELSRIGRLVNPRQMTPFSEVASEAAEMVSEVLRQTGVDLFIESALPAVEVDRARAVEALQNLLENAAKFRGDQPQPKIVVGSRRQQGEIVFFVADNGIGIDPRHHRSIFGLFDKLDPRTEGTGVGLAIVKRIVELHGGHIWLESEGLGKGSTFFFTFAPSRNGAANA